MMPFERLVSVPAHVHHTAYLMKDPPSESRAAREAFTRTLAALGIEPDRSVATEPDGKGVQQH
jgi:hypothetical protein